MKNFLMFAVVGLLIHCSLVEGATTVPPITAAASGATAGSPGPTQGTATDCYVCSVVNATSSDSCVVAQTSSSTSSACQIGVCIVEMEEDSAGNILSFDRKCHNQACNSDNDNSVFSQAAGSGTSYEKCCDDGADCNTFSADDLRNTAGKLTAGLAVILFGAIFLLVL
ncbi:Hypp5283 [Branchiostoma lanceolatum]|uniref:Hypp5283 protein n=1 Tax=Branchiostoma lanceolatum TaxID=7740 RepID=A0A8K0AF52_BRALA|nr:Hypp5283 [Branchiostoma lanceolatum]